MPRSLGGVMYEISLQSCSPQVPHYNSIYLGGVMYEISLQSCSPQVPHYNSIYLGGVMYEISLQSTGLSLHSIYLGGVMHEISLQSCSPQVPHYTVFTLVVSCMRSAFSPAAHRSLTTQYLPWWCHVLDQPSVLQPTGLSLHSIYLGGVMYEISLQPTGLSLQQYLPWWCHV